MKPRAAASVAGCALSHLSRLQKGEVHSIESYLPFLTAVRLDGAALLRYITKEAEPPEPLQAVSLLLDEAATATSSAALSAKLAATAWAPDQEVRAVLVHNIQAVLREDWNPLRKFGEICKLVRSAGKISLEKIGGKINYSAVHVRRLEAGNGAVTALERLARALGLDPKKLFAQIERESISDDGAIGELLFETWSKLYPRD